MARIPKKQEMAPSTKKMLCHGAKLPSCADASAPAIGPPKTEATVPALKELAHQEKHNFFVGRIRTEKKRELRNPCSDLVYQKVK